MKRVRHTGVVGMPSENVVQPEMASWLSPAKGWVSWDCLRKVAAEAVPTMEVAAEGVLRWHGLSAH